MQRSATIVALGLDQLAGIFLFAENLLDDVALSRR